MGNEIEEVLAESPEMSATERDRAADESVDETPDAEEGPSEEVLAEAAAAEREAAERTEAQGAEGAEAVAPPEADPEAAPEPEVEVEEGPGAQLSDAELQRVICALLFASPEALSESRLAQLAEGAPKARVKAALTALEADFADGPFPLELRKLAGGWRLMSAAEMSEVVARLFQARKADRLSAAGLETLSVVAYRQPVTKADIEAIRGVQCGPMLRMLVDRGLVKVTGRAELPGSPLEYGTTKDFLDRFGLGGLDELPRDGELLG